MPTVSVLSYRNDLALTGQNQSEIALNYASVSVESFGKLYATPVDGQVYAQPLYVPNVTITAGPNAGTHDVVYVATEHDSVYAIDSDDGDILWQRSFINPANGITTVPYTDLKTADLTPEIGITSTPVIDPDTNTIYVVAKTKEISAGQTHYVFRLHALDMSSGEDKLGGPAVIADTIYLGGSSYIYVSGPTVNGTGDGSINGHVTFNAMREHQRPALTLYNHTIYVASASHGDNGPYHGWVLGYDASSLALTAAFNATPNAGQGGIWMAGAGLSIDPQGFLYFSTGNGDFDTQLDANGFPIHGDYGNSFVKLAVDPESTPSSPNINGWGLKVVDYFTPFNQDHLLRTGEDLGSGGLLILPDSVGSAAHPHLLVSAGKEGKIYLIDRDNMGKFNPAGDNIVQTIPNVINGALSTPAYFNGAIYYVGGYGDAGKRFTIQNAQMTGPVSTTNDLFLFPGSSPSISSDGTNNGIVWNMDRGTNQLRAYKAGDYSQEIWNSSLAPGNRDELTGGAVKFAVPTVAAARVFIGTGNSLVGYGLFENVTTPPNAPTGLVAQAVSATQVRLTWVDEATNEAGYRLEVSTDGVNFSPAVTAPSNSDDFFVGNLNPLTHYYFRIFGFNAIGDSPFSNVAEATTSSGGAPGGLDFSLGFAASAGLLQKNGSAHIAGNFLQLTDGGNHERGSAFTTNRLDLRKFTTQFSFEILHSPTSAADGLTFTIQGVDPTALGSSGGGLGYGPGRPGEVDSKINQSVAIKFDIAWNAGEGNDSTGLYTNGASPTVPFIDLTDTAINLGNQHLFVATLTYDGVFLSVQIRDTVTDALVNHIYTVDIPSVVGASDGYFGFTGGTGGDTSTQNIRAWTYAPLTQPFAPRSLIGTAGPNQMSLTWQPVEDAVTYNVYRSTASNGEGAIPYRTDLTSTSFVDTGLGNAQTYFYKVTAVNSLGESARSNEIFGTTPSYPATPSNPVATGVQTTRLLLGWQLNSTNETGVRIIRKSGTGGTFDEIASLPAGTTAYADSGLIPGTLYDYHIIAFNELGYSDFAEVRLTTLAAAPDHVVSTNSAEHVELTWDPSFGATSYNIYRSETSFGIDEDAEPFVTGIEGLSFIDNSTLPGELYYYRVSAQNESGTGPLSSQVYGVVQGWRLAANITNTSLFDLIYAGTDGDDDVRFEQVDATTIRIVENILAGVPVARETVVSGVTGLLIASGYGGADQLDASLLTTTQVILDGGVGDDSLLGGAADDQLIGGIGNDLAKGGVGNDNILGGAGADTLYGEYPATPGKLLSKTLLGHDTISGGDDDDTIYGDGDGGEGTSDLIDGGAGSDIISADGSEGGSVVASDTITGGAGDDLINADGSEGGADVISGGSGNDTINGGWANDQINGDSGDDLIDAGGGNDFVDGGDGNDILLGGIDTGGTNDTLQGGNGRDILIGDTATTATATHAGGMDSIGGGADQDILIAGTVTFTDNSALLAIRDEWVSPRSYSNRTSNILGTGVGTRANGNSFLTPGVHVFDDRATTTPVTTDLADTVFGEDDVDWIFANSLEDHFTDLAFDEILTHIELYPPS